MAIHKPLPFFNTAIMPSANGTTFPKGHVNDFDNCSYLKSALTIFVAGASGELAKQQTYPSLFALFCAGYLPKSVIVCGYARSQRTDDEFRDSIIKHIKGSDDDVQAFLSRCVYHYGTYDDAEHIAEIFQQISAIESTISDTANRLFYLATPPTMYARLAYSLKAATKPCNGWSRFILEKPFGRDIESFQEMHNEICSFVPEHETFRIEHRAGHEMIQNLLVLRFANSMFEPLWNRHHVASVTITFKDASGMDGRGGIFNRYGIIRDVVHTHLMQVLAMVAMEPPVRADGDDIRAEKAKVLRCIDAVRASEAVLGQYTGARSQPGFTDDDGVPDDSRTPTYAALLVHVRNARWEGVPFILRAGKALNETKTEVRVQFRDAAGGARLFEKDSLPRNELVLRVQPDEALYLKTLVKQPGLAGAPVVSELDLSYKTRFADKFTSLPDAYTRLILHALRGDTAPFVRADEICEAWRIFAPLLQAIESDDFEPTLYKFGSRGPKEADRFLAQHGYVYHGKEYNWSEAK